MHRPLRLFIRVNTSFKYHNLPNFFLHFLYVAIQYNIGTIYSFLEHVFRIFYHRLPEAKKPSELEKELLENEVSLQLILGRLRQFIE